MLLLFLPPTDSAGTDLQYKVSHFASEEKSQAGMILSSRRFERGAQNK
jgi:hypothetical protein